MILRKVAYTVFFAFAGIAVNAQEVLVNLSTYPAYSVSNSKTSSSKAKGILTLPFFDDFSRNTVKPTLDLWEASSVTTNQNYGINPPTIGVATFDAINSKGELHANLTTTPQGADTLTSLPINLTYSADDSIYLSFCFQPQGLGYAPSSKDSLVLEFWDDSESLWVRAWSASVDFVKKTLVYKNILTSKSKTINSDTLNRGFYNAIINIGEQRFLSPNFRFRFVNYASLSANTLVPGLKSNSDHWHIDMVYLNKYRDLTDTIYNDVSFSKPIQNLMRNYTSLPWSHFNDAFKSEFPSPLTINIFYHNLGPVVWDVPVRFVIKDFSGLRADSLFLGGSSNIFPYQKVNYSRYFDFNFRSAWQDSAKFMFKSYLELYNNQSSAPVHLMFNDTISRTFEFHNYYAYDDGSAESGYGIFGEGTDDGMVAYKFNNYKADTLQGIMLYFNRTYADANQTTFKLTVWDDSQGKPGEIVYQKNGVRPRFSDSLNKYSIYRIDPTFIPKGTFYVGWIQTSQDMLNIGFDMNTDNQDKLYYNIAGDWVKTKYSGSLMIRPIFGRMHQTPTGIITPTSQTDFSVYPNPANEFISIRSDNAEINALQIINITGKVVLNERGSRLESINIQNLTEGIYIVRACLNTGKWVTHKLVVVR